MEPIHLDAILRLLIHSWTDVGFEYDGLTEEERACITREEFESTCRLMKGRGLFSELREP